MRALAVALLGLVLAWPAARAATSDCSRVRTLGAMERTVSLQGQVLDLREVQPLDRLSASWRRENIHIRYRVALDDCARTGQSMLWVYRMGGPFSVSADGRPLLALEPTAPVKARIFNGRVPALFALPTGARVLDIEIVDMPYLQHGLVDVVVGDAASLVSVRTWDHTALTLVNNTASLVIGVAGFMLLLGWRLRRHDKATLWFGVACLLWGLRGSLYQWFAIDESRMVFEQSNPLLIALTVLTLGMATLHRFGAWSRRWLMAAWIWLAVLAGGFLATVWLGAGGFPMRALTFVFATVQILATLGWLVVLARRGRPSAAVLAAGVAVLVLGALHDIGMVIGFSAPVNWSFLTPAFAVLLVTYGGVLFRSLLVQLATAEHANELLEERVAQKSHELGESYERLRASEAARTRAEERARISREMHDGIGSHLLATLRGVERGTLEAPHVAHALQDGLDELRLIINASDHEHGLFVSAQTWRHRWAPRLEAAGVELRWEIDAQLEQLDLDAHQVLQWLRVLQEAVTNALKHARPQSVSVQWLVQGSALSLRVSDDGSGLAPEAADAPGRGVNNMRHRARELGATIHWSPGAQGRGTCVEMTGPVQRALA